MAGASSRTAGPAGRWAPTPAEREHPLLLLEEVSITSKVMRDQNTRSNTTDTKLLSSRAHAHAIAPKAGDWRSDQQDVFLYLFCSHYHANRHRWPWPELGIKSVGRHPIGEP
ncbi:hypothetical protein EYF80_011273 [Liparis tanakae]|uniref:Uncharacterized protein n=1 Tax=Liparis tanakae TaxID=230148 RepID=A0A4Z2IKE2_9TELE|nr:hypothetical protein EYF80_011273 [Liparis tanakae]